MSEIFDIQPITRIRFPYPLPLSVAEFDTLRGDLAFKEGELEKSRYTVQSLRQEHVNLQANLQKVSVYSNNHLDIYPTLPMMLPMILNQNRRSVMTILMVLDTINLSQRNKIVFSYVFNVLILFWPN